MGMEADLGHHPLLLLPLKVPQTLWRSQADRPSCTGAEVGAWGGDSRRG